MKMKMTTLTALLLLAVFNYANAQCPNLIWADEFDGTSLDLTKWSYQIGDGCDEGICGWGNNEEQSYQQDNVTVSNGTLKITAKKERAQSKQYTSGRIRSINMGDWTYGRFEARIKLPSGAGLWPAFWMLPTDEVYGGWPMSGEIDIMENIGSDMSHVFGTIHYGDAWPNNQHQGGSYILENGSFGDNFHVYAIEWEEGEIRWYLDDILYSTKTVADVAPYNWPFDQNFHFILNVAVGGNLGGTVDTGIFPQAMEVDYVRVYDGPKTSVAGKETVTYQESGVTYNLANAPSGASVNWSVPADATIVSQSNSNITVDFGAQSGDIVADVTSSSCSNQVITFPVTVEPPYVYDFTFENFDAPATITLDASTTGTLSEILNPDTDATNSSALVGQYTRDSGSQYDLLVYNTGMITDGSEYKSKTKKFYMDVNTTAPIGTEIILQLENSAVATPDNYPGGRHSRYIGVVEANNEWQRIVFTYLDAPDPSTDDFAIDKLIFLFAANTFTGDTYNIDNFDSYVADTGNGGGTGGGTDPTSISVSVITTGTQSAGRGNSNGTATVTIVDDLGNPVSGATVSGTFSGTFNETASGTTDSNGVVTLVTTGAGKNITVNFCVDNVTGALPYDATQNVITCSSGSARMTKKHLDLAFFPNPVSSILNIGGNYDQLFIMDLSGRTILSFDNNSNKIDVSALKSGAYILKIQKDGAVQSKLLMKN